MRLLKRSTGTRAFGRRNLPFLAISPPLCRDDQPNLEGSLGGGPVGLRRLLGLLLCWVPVPIDVDADQFGEPLVLRRKIVVEHPLRLST